MKTMIILEKILLIAMTVYFFIYAIKRGKQLFCHDTKVTIQSTDIHIVFLNIPMIILFLIIYMILSLRYKKVLMFSSIMILLVYINGIVENFNRYVDVIKNPNTKKDYRLDQESTSFYLLMLLELVISDGWANIVTCKIRLVSNVVISDLLLMSFIFVYCSLLLSFIIGFLILIIKMLIYNSITKKIMMVINDGFNYLSQIQMKSNFQNIFNRKNKRKLWGISKENAAIFAYICLYMFLAFSSMSINVLKKIIIGIYMFFEKVANLTKEKDLSLYIRLSIGLSLILLVIENEYYNFLKAEESTSLLEFFASAIIIPMVFDSLNKFRGIKQT